MAEFIAGRSPAGKSDAVQNIANPVAALANLNRSIVQIMLAEDRFDESMDERAARIAAEAEAHAKAERAEAAERAQADARIRRAENKRQVQQAIRSIRLEMPHLSHWDREEQIAKLLQELDANDAYDGNPAEIVADFCIRLGANLKPPTTDMTESLERKARLVALARAHLAVLGGPDEPKGGDDSSTGADRLAFATSAKAQGPPN